MSHLARVDCTPYRSAILCTCCVHADAVACRPPKPNPQSGLPNITAMPPTTVFCDREDVASTCMGASSICCCAVTQQT
jgi:hypothetical protein